MMTRPESDRTSQGATISEPGSEYEGRWLRIGEDVYFFDGQSSKEWSGPVSPDLAQRIMALVEADNVYHQEQTKRLQKLAKQARIASILGMTTLVILTLLIAILLSNRGEEAIAVAVGITAPSLAALAAAVSFFAARHASNRRGRE